MRWVLEGSRFIVANDQVAETERRPAACGARATLSQGRSQSARVRVVIRVSRAALDVDVRPAEDDVWAIQSLDRAGFDPYKGAQRQYPVGLELVNLAL